MRLSKSELRRLLRHDEVVFGYGEINMLPQKIGDSLSSALSFLNRLDHLYGKISTGIYDKDAVEIRRKIFELDKLIMKASDVAYKLKQEFKDF